MWEGGKMNLLDITFGVSTIGLLFNIALAIISDDSDTKTFAVISGVLFAIIFLLL